MIDPFFQPYFVRVEEIEKHFEHELRSIRTGRATPSLVDDIIILAYENSVPLKQVASINTPDMRTIVIQPWDKSLLRTIENTIRDANIGLQGVVDGSLVRINIPPLTEESRKLLVKRVHEKLEQARIALRRERDKIKEEIFMLEKGKTLSEDERFRILKKLDEWIHNENDQFLRIAEKKEKEIMTI